MMIQVANVPEAAMLPLIKELEKHGMRVRMFGVDGKFGIAKCESGAALFKWKDEVLKVMVVRDEGHFEERMLRGGLKQLVGEVVEGLKT